MRVLLINQTFWPDPQATSQYLADWAQDLVKRGHEVTILTSQRSYHKDRVRFVPHEFWQGMTILRVWNAGIGHGSKGNRALSFGTFLLSAAWRIFALRRFDVVVTLTTPPLLSILGALLGLLWNARFIYWVMDLNPDEAIAVGWLKPKSPLTRLLEALSCWTFRRADQVIVLDRYMKERLLNKGIPEGKIKILSLWPQEGITFDAAGRERFRAEHGLGDRFVVIYSGNHTACHPLDTLFDAALLLHDHPKIHFCFIGGGSEWSKLRARAGVTRVTNMTFLDYQPREELSASLSAADLQVVSMGDAFVGIVHPCKVYNFLAAQRLFLYLGPEQSHIHDLIVSCNLREVTLSFRHGESRALADALSHRAESRTGVSWPTEIASVGRATEALEKMTSLLQAPGR